MFRLSGEAGESSHFWRLLKNLFVPGVIVERMFRDLSLYDSILNPSAAQNYPQLVHSRKKFSKIVKKRLREGNPPVSLMKRGRIVSRIDPDFKAIRSPIPGAFHVPECDSPAPGRAKMRDLGLKGKKAPKVKKSSQVKNLLFFINLEKAGFSFDIIVDSALKKY